MFLDWIYYIIVFIIGLGLFYKSNISGPKVLIGLSLCLIGIYNYEAAEAVIVLTLLTYFFQKSKSKGWLGIWIHIGLLIYVNYFSGSTPLFKLGLSYYALQNIGILLLTVRKSPQNYTFQQLLFANVFFSKFISGPILQPKEITALDTFKEIHYENLISGLNRILFGLFKKMVIADNLSTITNTVFQHPEAQFKGPTIAIATILFTFEMYLNFSAYTDVALGSAKLFNVHLKENFKRPFRSTSVTEYWRKTHISLIDWLTNNIFYYITYQFRANPVSSTVLGISLTFGLSGIWHGAELGFLVWGLLNAFYLIVEYLFKKKNFQLKNKWVWIGLIPTLIAVSFSNLFFRSKYLGNSVFYLRQLFNTESWNFHWAEDVIAILGNGGYLEQQFNLAVTITFLLIFLLLERKLEGWSRSTKSSMSYWVILLLFIFVFGNFNAGTEFIYMQF